MRILGIDPGMAIVGYALVKFEDNTYTLETSGSIRTDKDKPAPERLLEILNDMCSLVKKYQPDCASVEKLYFFKNQKTIIPVAESRGIILAALQKNSIPIFEYTPMEVKQVLTGYGRADKKDVEKMVKYTLNNSELPKLDDTVDAIAIAICHARNLF